MSIWCRLGRHEAAERIASNGSMYFGWCSRCEAELILSARGWGEIPKGYRVVWKRRGDEAVRHFEEQLELKLPAAGKRERSRPKRPQHAKGFGRGRRRDAAPAREAVAASA